MSLDLSPVTLTGRRVKLVPLTAEHGPGLQQAIGTAPVFRYFGGLPAQDSAAVPEFLKVAEGMVAAKTAIPFCTLDAETGQPIGSTRFGNIDAAHKRVEIGWTFIVPDRQRSGANREAKYLMLRHAFETLGCTRVELKTHHLNQQSRTAIAALGGVQEGILRNHMIMSDGSLRHSVVFSILPDEWPAVKARLESQLYPDGEIPA
jgi:RimJ/RimL family protein N-acetyltransferase